MYPSRCIVPGCDPLQRGSQIQIVWSPCLLWAPACDLGNYCRLCTQVGYIPLIRYSNDSLVMLAAIRTVEVRPTGTRMNWHDHGTHNCYAGFPEHITPLAVTYADIRPTRLVVRSLKRVVKNLPFHYTFSPSLLEPNQLIHSSVSYRSTWNETQWISSGEVQTLHECHCNLCIQQIANCRRICAVAGCSGCDYFVR